MKREKIPGKVGIYRRASETKRFSGKPDVCFEITFKVNEKKKWEKIGWQSEGYSAALAAETRAQRIKDARHGSEVKTAAEIRSERLKHNKTLEEVKEHFFNSERGQAMKGRQTDIYRYNSHLSFLGKKRIPELTVLDIEQIKRNMMNREPATRKHALKMLCRIVNYGVEFQLCPALSFKVKFPKVDNIVTEYLTDEQAARYLEVLESWPRQDIARMVRMAWLTGLRRGELFKLKRENIDFEKDLITLVNPKGGTEASIPLTLPVKELIKAQIAYLSEQTAKRERRYANSKQTSTWQEQGFLFPGINGGQRVDCSAISRIKKKAKLPESFRPFHGLRHHMAVTLASSGEYTLDMIGELLTHKDSSVTRRYAKYLPESANKAANKAADLLIRQTEKTASGKLKEVVNHR